MGNLDDMELIDKFVEDSLNKEELILFNKRYNEDTEFAKLANSYLDMSVAIKAADQFGRTRLKNLKDNQRYFADYKWVISIAASLVVITVLSFYAIHLNRKNISLSDRNYEFTADISKLKQEIEIAATHNQIDKNIAKPVTASNNLHQETGDMNRDRKYFSSILALNKIIETNLNKSITRNSGNVTHVFPVQSKLVNKNDAFVAILKQNQISKASKFYLIDFASNDTIFRINNISSEIIALNNSGMQYGGKYYWIITYQDGSAESGSISMISAAEKNKVKEFSLQSGSDYLEAFIYYYNNGYYFEAQSVLKKAVIQYQNEKLFVSLKQLLYQTTTL
jgi:hypothetical protein